MAIPEICWNEAPPGLPREEDGLMPLYEYQCDACGRRFELIRKFSDPPLDTCPSCGGVVRKLMSSPAFQFKGSGWYITDYAKKGQAGPASEETKSEAASQDKDSSQGKDSSKDEAAKAGDKAGKPGKTAAADKSGKAEAPAAPPPTSKST
jgi:putative FmdB family regulatory protein